MERKKKKANTANVNVWGLQGDPKAIPDSSAGQESACNAGDPGSIPGKRDRLPTPVFWPEEFHGLYSPWAHKELDVTFTFISRKALNPFMVTSAPPD